MNHRGCDFEGEYGADATRRRVASIRSILGEPHVAGDPASAGWTDDEVVSNPRIAIVDDEPINIRVVRKYLELAGYRQFFTTTDARRAVDLVRASRPDVVLLDIMMPHLSGLEILAQLRGQAEHADLPVIVLTAATDRPTRLEAIRLGANEFLGKPVDSVELEARLRNVLQAKAQQDQIKNYAGQLELEVAARSAGLTHAYEEVIQCLAKVGEYRDTETGRHVVRVGRYAEIIARQLGMGEEFAGRIRRAAPLHDIGKVGIPDYILLKPGKLDEAERRLMQRHCVYGKEICSVGLSGSLQKDDQGPPAEGPEQRGNVSPILQMAATIAYTHHEKWDGSGYPHGLAGEAIPLEGRITAVADVFDALTTKRPYKEAFGVDESLEMMWKMRATHFDPEVFDAFLAAADDAMRVHHELADTPVETAGAGVEPAGIS